MQNDQVMNPKPSIVSTPQQVANLIVERVRPSEIAKNLKISAAELEPILARAVVLGHIRRSDILFALPQSLRETVEPFVNSGKAPSNIHKYLQIVEEAVDECEIAFLCAIIKQRAVHSDLYELLSEIETILHTKIRQCLEKEFCGSPDAWWSKGVPLPVRKACAAKREEDENPSEDLFNYTTLIELKAIIEGGGQWNYFEKRMPSGAQNKPKLMDDLNRLNRIRNRVMHPVRLDCSLGETEYRFVSKIHNTLVTCPWNLSAKNK